MWGWRGRRAVGAVLTIVAVGCASAPETSAPATVPPAGEAFATFLALADGGHWRGAGDDAVEVWVCHVPAESTAPEYGGLPLRLDLTAVDVAAAVAPLTGYFDELSLGAYRPRFVAGGEVELATADGPAACVEAALAAAGDDAEVVLAVADAEHAPGQVGGMGSEGRACTVAPPCPAAESRRYAYVGASDFHPDWGAAPPLDLVAHELGHTLGLVHSGYDPSAEQPYRSALDVMSNSAAAREAQPERRDAPGTLAVQRLIAGWLPPDAAAGVPAAGGEVTLAPSNGASGASGARVLVLPVDDRSFLTVEVLTADGLDAHLPHDGVAVHRVAMEGGDLVVDVVAGIPAATLLRAGEQLTAPGWRVVVGDGWHLTIEPAAA